MPQNLELSKIRDFGEIITDTFTFIRQNYKPLIKCFFVFCGFFLIGGSVFSAMQQAKAVNVINGISTFQSNSNLYESSRFAQFGIEYFLDLLFLLFNYIAMHVTVYSYICLYKVKGNIAPTVSEVWGYFKYFFFKILGSGFLLVLLLAAPIVVCSISTTFLHLPITVILILLSIILIVYLYPILALVFPVMIFENTSLRYAYNRSFRLFKDNWWITFGTLVVIGLIVYFAFMAIMVPLTILNFSNLFLHPKGGLHISSTLTIITSIVQHIGQVFYIVPLITLSLCYFNLTERLDGTGLMERINQLGSTGPDSNLPVEEY
jgi:hypothetical protein